MLKASDIKNTYLRRSYIFLLTPFILILIPIGHFCYGFGSGIAEALDGLVSEFKELPEVIEELWRERIINEKTD